MVEQHVLASAFCGCRAEVAGDVTEVLIHDELGVGPLQLLRNAALPEEGTN
jgi:hypothetical protein